MSSVYLDKILAAFKKVDKFKWYSITTTGIIAYYGFKGVDSQRKYNKEVIIDQSKRVRFLQEQVVKESVHSIRHEVPNLKLNSTETIIDGQFVLVRGPRGVGKTSAICSALKDTAGVIRTPPVQPGVAQDTILDDICNLVTGLEGGWKRNREQMLALVHLFKEINGRPLIVIITASQRSIDQQPAELTAAARVLVDEFGLKVFIDCSENACPTILTDREIIIDFEPMRASEMIKLPNYQKISGELEKLGYTEIVLAICGGRPLLLSQLMVAIQEASNKGQNMDYAIRGFVLNNMRKARKSIVNLLKFPGIENELNKFKSAFEIPLNDNTTMPDMKGVLRLVKDDTLVPATGAVALQLRMGIDKIYTGVSTFEEIQDWLKKQNSSVKASLLLKDATNN